MIRAIDIGVKQVYKAAQEQSDRETILVFTSDNGAEKRFLCTWCRESHSRTPFPNAKFHSQTGCNYPLKGQKSSLNEVGSQNLSNFRNFELILTVRNEVFENYLKGWSSCTTTGDINKKRDEASENYSESCH